MKNITNDKLNKIKNLFNELIKWDMNILVNNSELVKLDQFDYSQYKTIPIYLIDKFKVGLCWDFVNYQSNFFKKHNIDYESYILIYKDSYANHTFNIIKIDNKMYWFEASWVKFRGIHEISSISDVIYKLNKDGYFIKSDLYKYNEEGMDNNLTPIEFINKIIY